MNKPIEIANNLILFRAPLHRAYTSVILFVWFAVAIITPSQASLVFYDDFSEADGTPLQNKLPDVGGGAWNVTQNPTGFQTLLGSVDTFGADRQAFGLFTSALASGGKLTLTYTTVPSAGFFANNGWAGISLYTGATERVFTGDLNIPNRWGVTGSGILTGGGNTTDNNQASQNIFTYFYNTGQWTFKTSGGASLSGTGTPNLAFDRIRIGSGQGAGINVSDFLVTIPEPGRSLFLLLGLVGFVGKRRRR